MSNISLNYTTEKYNLFFNVDGGLRQRGNHSNSDIEYINLDGTTRSHYDIDQYSLNPNYMGSFKIGGEYYFDDHNSLLLSYQLRGGNRQRHSDIYARDVYFHNDSLHYDQTTGSDNVNMNNSFNLLYTKKFDRKDEELTFDATFSTRNRPLLSPRKRDGESPSGAEPQNELAASVRQRLVSGDGL